MLLLHDLHLETFDFGLTLDQIIGSFCFESNAQLDIVSLLVAMALDLKLRADSLSIIFNLLQYQSVSLGQLRVHEDEILE